MIFVYWEATPRFCNPGCIINTSGKMEIISEFNSIPDVDIDLIRARVEKKLTLAHPDFYPDGAEVSIKMILRVSTTSITLEEEWV